MTNPSYGAQTYQRERQARDTAPKFNLAELVRDLQSHEQARGANAEWLQGYASITGGQYNASAPRIPIECLLSNRLRLDDLLMTRDMTAAGSSGSQYLASPASQGVIEQLKPYSATASAGMETVIATGNGGMVYPTESSGATAYWLTNESTAITESQPILGEQTASYHGLGVTLQVSRQLLLQSDSGAWLRRSLLRSIGRKIDAAVLAGTGISGQPAGLANSSPIVAIAGTSIDVADINGAIRHIRDAGLDQRQITWIAGPAAEEILRNREATSSSGRFIWEGDSILGMPAYGTPDAPTNSLFVGPWQEAKIVLWGDLAVQVNPFSDFARGLSALRVMVGADVIFPQTAAFAYAPTLT
jgi:HK97 family phage major capsid protein